MDVDGVVSHAYPNGLVAVPPMGPRLADTSRQTNYRLEKISPTIYRRGPLPGHSSLKDRERGF